MNLRRSYKRWRNKLAISRLNGTNIDLELERINRSERFETGITDVFGKPFKYHDGASFADTFREIFKEKIYEFRSAVSSRTILDCGANMGLSVLYFSLNYPDHQIIAFEPEKAIFDILEENVSSFQLKNVTLHNKAVWTKADTLAFYSDGGMGGRLIDQYANQEPVLVEAVPLSDFLSPDVAFLKLDIEGAEVDIIKKYAREMGQVKHLFFEYHNKRGQKQTLHELLTMLQEQGFTYYIKESARLKKPFVDEQVICETFDMALNVFCYKS